MIPTPDLGLFFLVVLGVVLLPGLDMAFVLGSTLAGGRGAGLAAVAGIVAGGVAHVAMGAAGVAALVAARPLAFNLVRVAGAAYLLWIGVALLRAREAGGFPAGGSSASRVVAFRRGMLTNLLNPKAYAFTLAILPPYLRPELGPLWRQAVVLSAIIAGTQVVVYGAVSVVADQARAGLEHRPRMLAWLPRAVGALLLLGAVAGVLRSWRPGF